METFPNEDWVDDSFTLELVGLGPNQTNTSNIKSLSKAVSIFMRFYDKDDALTSTHSNTVIR